jgi:hypothetical protein
VRTPNCDAPERGLDVRLVWFEPGKRELARKQGELRKTIDTRLKLRRRMRSRWLLT